LQSGLFATPKDPGRVKLAPMSRRRGVQPSLYLVASILYFSEGLPFGAVTELLPLYLRSQGVALAKIGLLSTIGLAWSLKVFWAPLVDGLATYRRWIIGALIFLSLAWAALSFSDAAGNLFWCLVAVLALASATQDIAIDALTVERTPAELLGPINSIRVTAYRVAIIVAGGAFAALSAAVGWSGVFRIGAILSVLLVAIAFFTPEVPRTVGGTRGAPLRIPSWMHSWQGGLVVALVLLYKLGDAALAPMIKPFWIDRGYSPAETGMVTTVFGVSLTVAGAVAGGLAVKHFGVQRSLLWLGLSQMLSNAGYALAASLGGGRVAMYIAAGIESFTGGLGTAAFLSFLMFLCNPERAATEYALLTALYSLSRGGIGSVSGVLAQHLGYATYFWMTVALGAPALLLIPRWRPADRPVQAGASA
jgi:PAT family beta-lactamase induction signal transducer AmpG